MIIHTHNKNNKLQINNQEEKNKTKYVHKKGDFSKESTALYFV